MNLPNDEIFEERQGTTRLYPHTDQLPELLRAVYEDFHRPLLPRFKDINGRSSDFDKIVLKHAALLYGSSLNAERPEGLILYPLADRELVSRPAIVQQITQELPFANLHRFRFFGGENFFPEFYVCGKRVAFTDNVFKQFSRLEADADIAMFLLVFFNSPMVSLPVNEGRGFVVVYSNSVLAFPYTETEREYCVNACLTADEINPLGLQLPPYPINHHYDLPYIRPQFRNWVPFDHMHEMYKKWEEKAPPVVRDEKRTKTKWRQLGPMARDLKKQEGHGHSSKIVFFDRIPGPYTLEIGPGKGEIKLDEINLFKKAQPQYAWDREVAERERDGTYPRAIVGGDPM